MQWTTLLLAQIAGTFEAKLEGSSICVKRKSNTSLLLQRVKGALVHNYHDSFYIQYIYSM